MKLCDCDGLHDVHSGIWYMPHKMVKTAKLNKKKTNNWFKRWIWIEHFGLQGLFIAACSVFRFALPVIVLVVRFRPLLCLSPWVLAALVPVCWMLTSSLANSCLVPTRVALVQHLRLANMNNFDLLHLVPKNTALLAHYRHVCFVVFLLTLCVYYCIWWAG